ncbi:MAG: CcmD family protein [Flavobacteriales bacterium]|nr:CcmD family protein [Flavobacteriales bacterium]
MKTLLAVLMLLLSNLAMAAGADTSMHEQGKIKVVIGVVAIIFIGIVVYLFMLDRKISKIEKDINEK